LTVTSASGSNIGLSEFQVLSGLGVSPRSAVLTFQETQQFQTSDTSTNVTWSIDGIQGGNNTVGTISTSGLYTPPAIVGQHVVKATSPTMSGTAQVYVTNYPGVFTQHNDMGRTGQNLQETVLTPSNVNPTQFGKLYSFPVDGYVYAQPLYVQNVSMAGQGNRNVVFVATEHDSVYAFDADSNSPTPLWHTSLINPAAGITTVSSTDLNSCEDIVPEIGITATPVIDPSTGTLYVAAKTKENGNYFWRLHALDITTGLEKISPVVIQGTVPGTGAGNDGQGHVAFNSQWQNNRPGLLVLNGVIHLGFGSFCDYGPYHGWIFSYDAASLKPLGVFNTTPNGNDGAIWQGGGGIAADSSGYLYVATGNGTFDASTGGSDYGDSVLKLQLQGSGLAVVDYFTPYNEAALSANDEDLGSGGPLLLADQSGSYPHLLAVAGKGGTLYLLSRDNLGKFQTGSDGQIVQAIPSEFPAGDQGLFGVAAYWNGKAFFNAGPDHLKAFTLSNDKFSTPPVVGPDLLGPKGASPSISSNGASNGIVWLLQADAYSTKGPAVLHAYNASNVTQELYISNQAGSRDQAGPAVKFSVPTIANGKVFVGSGNSVTVYSLLP
jgi:hypothetical protein